ncbi:MAG: metallophosphoesterase [Patescibacteria group bacterium]
MKIAQIADLHIDENNRFSDTLACLDWIIDDAIKADVKLFLAPGDFFGKDTSHRSTPRERKEWLARLQTMTKQGEVVGCYGNHDAPEDLDIYEGLAGVRMFNKPGVAFLSDGTQIAVLPYPHKASILKGKVVKDIEESNQAVAEELKKTIDDLAKASPLILIAHITVSGSETSTGQLLLGGDIQVGSEVLESSGAAYIALGHIHKAQKIGKCYYSGSINKMNFGEKEDKGYNLITIEDGKLVSVEFRKAPARELIFVEGKFQGDKIQFAMPIKVSDDLLSIENQIIAGADVRFRYFVNEEDLPKVNLDEVKEIFKDAHLLQIERSVNPKIQIRSQEIATAQTIAEKFQVWTKIAGIDNAAMVAGCVEKLNQIEI